MQLPAFAKATGHPAAPYPSPGRVATRKCVDMRCGRRVGWRQMGAEGAMTTVTIEQMVERWSDPNARPPFKGALIDDDGCCCAQGDVLRQCGWSDERLRSAEQREADRSVAQALGISLTQAILLGVINDQQDGCPQDVLAHPERVLGNQAPRILALWRRFDAMTPQQWDAAMAAAGAAAAAAAAAAAWAAARAAAGTAARAAAGAAAWAAANATNEVQGAERLQSFFFLPLFGINHPSEFDG